MSEGDTAELGQELHCRVTAPLGQGDFAVEYSQLAPEWSARLRSRSGQLYNAGDEDDFWVYLIDSHGRVVWLTDCDFGRLPISDRMRPRYTKCLRSSLALLSGRTSLGSADPQDLSEFKGMFNRCLRRDQWDWLTVYAAWGRPTSGTLRQLASWTAELSRALRHGESEDANRYLRRLSSAETVSLIEGCLQRIEEGTPRLSDAMAFVPLGAADGKVNAFDREADGDPYIVSRVARTRMERSRAEHQRTLGTLIRHLERNGYVVECNRLVDAYCRLRTGPAIFEVKSTDGGNERSQTRHALSQLYEYRYLHSIPDASLWLVLSRRPRLEWLIDYLQADRGVTLVWVEEDELAGSGVGGLT